jgi:hypothetical protein
MAKKNATFAAEVNPGVASELERARETHSKFLRLDDRELTEIP